MADAEENFDLAAWEMGSGLNRRMTEVLGKEDYTTRAVLKAMTVSDVAALNITGGQARTLKLALGALGNPAFTDAPTRPVQPETERETRSIDNVEEPVRRSETADAANSELAILQAGEALDRMWTGEVNPLPGVVNPLPGVTDKMAAGSHGPAREAGGGAAGYSPTMLLTIKASAKKVFHVTSFIPEGVKQRLTKRRRENLRWTESPDGTVSLQADDRVPVYLSQVEWGAANVRLMYHMMTEGELPGANIGEYLAYTVMIFEFASKYDWQSVLDFDVRYREQQAQHNFRWERRPSIWRPYSLRPVAKQQGQTRILGSSKGANRDRLAE